MRRIKEGTSAILWQSGLDEKWRADSMECNTYLRNVRRVFSARGPDSSVGGVPVVSCPGVDHMEEEVQVQVEVQRKEQGMGETHGKEQGEEQRAKERTTAQRG